MFSPKRPVNHVPRTPLNSPKVARPYGQTKLPDFHPRKAYPVPPPTPFDLRGARRAHVQNENVGPAADAAPPQPGTTPRRRRPRSEGTDYPPREEWKNFRYIAPPPSRYPQPVGDQIYVDCDDAVQPLVNELKSKGPLDAADQLMLQRLSQLRISAMMRQSYHNQAVIIERGIAEAPKLDRYRQLREIGAAKRRELSEQREKKRQQELKEADERKKKEQWEALRAAALKQEQEQRRREQEMRDEEARRRKLAEEEERRRQQAKAEEQRRRQLAAAEEQRRRERAQVEEQRRRERAEADERRRREHEEAQRRAELERIRELHLRRLREVEEQKRKEEEMKRRWEELQRERERRMREEQERAAREAEEAARRAREEQERAAREAQERAAQEERERAAREEQAQCAQAEVEHHMRQICDLYERKWTELKTNRELKNIVDFTEFPFPVFTYSCTSPADITYERVREFLFHPFRTTIEGKTRKEILKVEVLRWHPDKFDTFIHPKIRDGQWETTKEAAGLVARWVTRLMAEE